MIDRNQIPSSWEVVKLGEVCFTTSGGTPSRKVSKYYEGNIPWVKSGELEHNVILDSEESISEEAIENSSTKIFPKGTLLIALYGATVGKLAFLGIDAATNQAVCGIFKNEIINSKFLYHYLFFQRPKLVGQSFGGAQPNISQTILKELAIPLPPLPEQHRIVSKIEELFSELDKGIESLNTAQQQLKIYRQAVLKRAFEGRLTHGNVKDGELPEGWKWVKIAEVAESMKNGLYKPADVYSEDGIACLRMYNIDSGKILWFDIKRMNLSKEDIEEYGLKEGDLLVNRVNSRELVGKTAVIRKYNEPIVYESKNIRLRVKSTINSEYLNYWFLLSANKYFNSNAQQTVGMASINQKQLSNFEFPLPLFHEQRQIVQEIETRLSVCDKLEETITTALQQSEALRQSILKKAFEGKLVEQNPKDEPASKLLARIKTVQEKNETKNEVRKKKIPKG